jgi:hypothetical protein
VQIVYDSPINNQTRIDMPHQLDESDLDYMRAEDFHRRRYQANLASHHDCRDPDHPGCELCEEENEE